MNRQGREGVAFPAAAVNAMKATSMLPQGVPETPPNQTIDPTLKAFLFEKLAELGVATVTVHYDGEGDSGQIEEIEALTANGAQVLLGKTQPFDYALYKAHGVERFTSLHHFLTDVCWECLVRLHCGYENNDGGFGIFTFDVAAKTISVEHNDRFVDFTTTESEV